MPGPRGEHHRPGLLFRMWSEPPRGSRRTGLCQGLPVSSRLTLACVSRLLFRTTRGSPFRNSDLCGLLASELLLFQTTFVPNRCCC